MDTMTRVRELADEREMSLFQLSLLCDVPYSTLLSTQNRKGELKVSTIEKICIGLRIPMSLFFTERGERI